MLYVLFFCLALHTTLWKSVPETSLVPPTQLHTTLWGSVQEPVSTSAASEGERECPPANVTFVDSVGKCVYLCIDGKRIEPCVTGPFDKMEVVKW